MHSEILGDETVFWGRRKVLDKFFFIATPTQISLLVSSSSRRLSFLCLATVHFRLTERFMVWICLRRCLASPTLGDSFVIL